MAVLIIGAAASLATSAEDGEAMSSENARASARAKQLLAKTLQVPETDIALKSVEPKTWNDSSLGCGKPDSLALQVITEGYAVVLSAQGRDHVVHVSSNNAVVCDRPTLVRKPRGGVHRARGLDVMMQKAREDLADRLAVDPAKIRIDGMKPQQWADSGMECPIENEPIEPGPISGYRLFLKYDERSYSYHTDMKSVRPCPEIEKE
jgi:hypothetical protein